MVWRFVQELDLSALYATIKAVEGHPGHPPADPRLLVALWLYATLEGVGSARALARLCEEHLAFQWLCGGVGVNHKTLSDFRVGHGAVLERLLVDSFAALLRAGAASIERIAQDGVRVQACAGAASFRRRSTLVTCRERAAAEIARLRAELDADPAACSRRQAGARERAAMDRERRVREALAVAEALHGLEHGLEEAGRQTGAARAARTAHKAARKAARKGRGKDDGGVRDDDGGFGPKAPPPPPREPRVSTTDPEARVMKMADGGFRPAWNVQLAVDTRSGAIAAVAVDSQGSDMGRLASMSAALEAAYGTRPVEHLADGGFAKLADIETLAEAGVVAYVPPPVPRNRTRDRHAPRPGDSEAVAAWRVRMGRDPAKAVYRQRAASVECANAQARNRGLMRFMVRGVVKAKAAVLWLALAHNMACGWRLAQA